MCFFGCWWESPVIFCHHYNGLVMMITMEQRYNNFLLYLLSLLLVPLFAPKNRRSMGKSIIQYYILLYLCHHLNLCVPLNNTLNNNTMQSKNMKKNTKVESIIYAIKEAFFSIEFKASLNNDVNFCL